MFGSVIEGVKKIEIPTNMVSNLGDIKTARVSENVIDGMRKYYENNTKMVSSMEKETYRERITKLYNKLEGIKPVDSNVNGVIYLNDYLEKGITVKPSVSALKQVWTEYRLIYNELEKKEEKNMEENIDVSDSYVLSNFDEIYDRLSRKIDGVGDYVEKLTEMKESVNTSTSALELEKQDLQIMKQEFARYKEEEERKLDIQKEELKKKMDKIDSLVKVFDLKMSDII